MMTSTNPYVLITGASAGIGYELAKLFAADNYNLVIVARNEVELEKVSSELKRPGIEVIPISKDLFNREEVFSLHRQIKDLNIAVDVLVNNAGQGVYGEFKDTELERELNIIELNISSMVILTKLFLEDMLRKQSGKILNLASIASKVPGPWQSVYHGTKAFVLSFSEAIREELKETGVTVTALLPGPTDTDFFKKADMEESAIIQDSDNLSDPSAVARDGYEALMSGKDKVISGFKNKVQVGMSNLMPDSTNAHMMYEQQKPVDQK